MKSVKVNINDFKDFSATRTLCSENVYNFRKKVVMHCVPITAELYYNVSVSLRDEKFKVILSTTDFEAALEKYNMC